MDIDIEISEKQQMFLDATEAEVLYGGAAGGGKSYAQIVDAMLFALKYPRSKQLILRRTFAELDKSLIRTSLGLYPKDIYTFNSSAHTGKFTNGSIIDFGYCATENDVFQYQSAEYDVIRFDELTHFTEFQYQYLISRVRGANGFPKQIKSSTNPGGVGHTWVKARFVDPSPPNTRFVGQNDTLTKIFIPALLSENPFLQRSDPSYKERLMSLPEREKKSLLYGDWNIFEGQYFTEWKEDVHVCNPFPIPNEWRRYRAFDYGLDRLACYWIAVSSTRDIYIYRELCESNLPISVAAQKMNAMTEKNEDIYCTLAPPDLWSRSQETGKSKFILFDEAGLRLTKSSNDREAGWLAIKELLLPDANGHARIHIFNTCRELIKCLPALQIDARRPTDCATEPHEITHAPDALRYFCVYWHRPNKENDTSHRIKFSKSMYEDYLNASDKERREIERMCGGKPEELTLDEYEITI